MEEQKSQERPPAEEVAREGLPPGKQPEGPRDSEAGVYRERWIRVSADLDNLQKLGRV